MRVSSYDRSGVTLPRLGYEVEGQEWPVPVYFSWDERNEVWDCWSRADGSGFIGYAVDLDGARRVAARYARARAVRP